VRRPRPGGRRRAHARPRRGAPGSARHGSHAPILADVAHVSHSLARTFLRGRMTRRVWRRRPGEPWGAPTDGAAVARLRAGGRARRRGGGFSVSLPGGATLAAPMPAQRLTLDSTATIDLLDEDQARNTLALRLLELAKAGRVELVLAASGHIHDSGQDAARRLRELEQAGVLATVQLAYPRVLVSGDPWRCGGGLPGGLGRCPGGDGSTSARRGGASCREPPSREARRLHHRRYVAARSVPTPR
jgi:hypothetical protein